MSDVTRILTAIEPGDAKASEELLPLVYHELRRQFAELFIDQRPQIPGGLLVAVLDGVENLRDVAHRPRIAGERRMSNDLGGLGRLPIPVSTVVVPTGRPRPGRRPGA